MRKAILTAITIAALTTAYGDDLKVTINPHSSTEVAMAAADGFSSVEEWYAHINKDIILPDQINRLKRTWASLSPQQQRSLRDAENKWERWYNSLPSKTAQNIARRIEALEQHNRDLEAWLPQPAKPIPTRPPTTQEMGTPMTMTPEEEMEIGRPHGQ